MNTQVDEYIDKRNNWKLEISQLREIALECGLDEELKWKQPCYTYKGDNIFLLGAFKDYCTVSFFKGVLLADADKLLVSPGANSQSVMMLKFMNSADIISLRDTIKTYIFEAIENQKAGLKVELNKSKNLKYPEELLQKFKVDPNFGQAFEELTDGRKRGYILFFEEAKQSQTKTTRIEKYMSRIRDGKGIHDCVCGLSKKGTKCDGSHKFA